MFFDKLLTEGGKPNLLAHALAAALLLGVLAIAYQDAPDNVFHFDDRYSIVEHSPTRIDELSLKNLYEAGARAHLSRRPLPSVTFAFDWWRGNGDPRPFQWTNLLIHAGNALLVMTLLYVILVQIGGYGKGVTLVVSLLAASAWGLHPIQTQAVTYIVQRMASMAAMFIMLSVLCYLLARWASTSRNRSLLFVLSGLFIVFGSMCKETAWITPLLLVLAEYGIIRHRQSLIRNKLDAALIGLPLILGALAMGSVLGEFGPLYEFVIQAYDYRDFSLVERLLTQPRVIWFHLSQVVWPMPGRFSIEHDFIVSTSLLQPPMTLLALLALGGLIAGGFALIVRQNTRVVGFFLLWIPLTLAIESSFIGLEMVFEHRMYVPLFGLAGLAALGLRTLFAYGANWRYATICVAGVLLAGLTLSTQQRVPVWSDVLRLLQNAVENAPNQTRVWSNIARHYINIDRLELAEPAVRQALRLNPDHSSSLEALGVIQTNQGKIAEAEATLMRAYFEDKVSHTWLVNMGVLSLLKGDTGIKPVLSYGRALDFFQRAREMIPWAPDYVRNTAIAYAKTRQCGQARREWTLYFSLEQDPAKRAQAEDFMRQDFSLPNGACSQ